MAGPAVARRSTHSRRPEPAHGRRSAATPSAAPSKRDLILRAATDVFADRGFFNAQVADVARAAGIAAGTVYLYFRSKDDLLVSIFERTMRDGLAEGRTGPVCGCFGDGRRGARRARMIRAGAGRGPGRGGPRRAAPPEIARVRGVLLV